MPAEVAKTVLSYLDINSLCAASKCCRKWRDLTNNDLLWLVLHTIVQYCSLINQTVLYSELWEKVWFMRLILIYGLTKQVLILQVHALPT